MNNIQKKIYPIHNMKVYMGSKGTAPLILKFRTKWRRAVNCTCQVLYLLSGPESTWVLWRREKFLVPARIQTPDCPATSLPGIPTTLFHLQYIHKNYTFIFNNVML
jgi:hypothetical protein